MRSFPLLVAEILRSAFARTLIQITDTSLPFEASVLFPPGVSLTNSLKTAFIFQSHPPRTNIFSPPPSPPNYDFWHPSHLFPCANLIRRRTPPRRAIFVSFRSSRVVDPLTILSSPPRVTIPFYRSSAKVAKILCTARRPHAPSFFLTGK